MIRGGRESLVNGQEGCKSVELVVGEPFSLTPLVWGELQRLGQMLLLDPAASRQVCDGVQWGPFEAPSLPLSRPLRGAHLAGALGQGVAGQLLIATCGPSTWMSMRSSIGPEMRFW